MSGFILIWCLNVLGFTALASSMSKHQKQFFGHELNPQKTRIAQILGWLVLVITIVACIQMKGSANGISYWIGTLTTAALVVLAILSYFPQHFKILSISSAVLAVLSLIVYWI